jgi:hemin uptake protein HemP
MYFSEAENPEAQAYSSPAPQPPVSQPHAAPNATAQQASSPQSADPQSAAQPTTSLSAAAAKSEADLPLAARIINSKSLFGESRIIHIEHRGMIYRMSITNQNRLILQK